MRVEVKVIREADNDVQRQSASIETHTKRGDAFNIHSAKDVVEGETQTFSIPPGGRIVINTPLAIEKPVYDRDQAAAVYASQQAQGREGGDRPNPDDVVKAREADLAQAKEAAQRQKEMDQREADAAAASQRTPPQGGQPLSNAQRGVAGAGPSAPRPNDAPVGSNESPNSKSSQSSPMPGQTGMAQNASGTTAKTTTTPNTAPAHGGAPQGGNTEKK